jgi:anti-repressor protein
MKELVLNLNENVVTSSLIVAEIYGKRHVEVLDAIREIINKSKNSTFVENQAISKMFVLDSYENPMPVGGGVKSNPIYYMNRDGFSLLIMGFTGSKALEFKLKFIDAFNTMEKVIKESMAYKLPDFTNPAKAAIAWAKEYEAKELAEAKVKEIEPTVDVLKAICDSGKEYKMSEVSKIMEVKDADGNVIGRNKFFTILRNEKILRDSNEPYQRFVNSGYFIFKTNLINDQVINTCYVTARGLAWLQLNKQKIFKF